MTSIYVKVPLSIYSGYGNDGYGIVRALMRAGADVYIDPTAVQAPVPADVLPLLARPVQGPFDIAIVHVDPALMEVSDSLRDQAKVVIGWTMWEFSNLDNLQTFVAAAEVESEHKSWALAAQRRSGGPRGISAQFIEQRLERALEDQRDLLRERLKDFDILVGYDQNTVNGLSAYFDGPIVVVQGGYEPKRWLELERDWTEQEFRFCQIGVLSERKDPFVTIAAFVAAQGVDAEFQKHARLSLKTVYAGLHSKMEDVVPNVRIFYDIWPEEVVQQFYAANHVLIAPSRGEGKNMPALEFMSTGGSVIATNWGGHTQWLSNEYAYPLDYRLEPESEGGTSYNARASIEHLRDLMLHCFHNRAEVREKGQRAAQAIPAMCSWDKVMERFMLRTGEALPDEQRAVVQRALAFLDFSERDSRGD